MPELVHALTSLRNRKANHLFGLCLSVWKTPGFDRFHYAAIE